MHSTFGRRACREVVPLRQAGGDVLQLSLVERQGLLGLFTPLLDLLLECLLLHARHRSCSTLLCMLGLTRLFVAPGHSL